MANKEYYQTKSTKELKNIVRKTEGFIKSFKTTESKEKPNKERVEESQRRVKLAQKELSRRELEPSVSDHAIVRYMERVLGYNIDVVRKGLKDMIPTTLSSNQGVWVPIEGTGLSALIRGNTMMTVSCPVGKKD